MASTRTAERNYKQIAISYYQYAYLKQREKCSGIF